MALLFNASTEQVNHGGSLNLTDPFTVIFVIKPSTVSDAFRQVAAQSESGGGGQHRIATSHNGGSAGMMRLFIPTANSLNWDCITVASTITADEWQIFAFRLDSGDSQQCRIFRGTFSSIMAEVSYDSALLLGNTFLSTAGEDFIVGRDLAGSFPYEGDIAAVIVWPSTALTLADMIKMQWRFLPQVVGDELFTHYGYNGTGTQPDWSGNGNNGTVTGATVSDHAPFGPPFGFMSSAFVVTAVAAGLMMPAPSMRHPMRNPLLRL